MKHSLHPNQNTTWNKEFLSNAHTLYENSKSGLVWEDNENEEEELLMQIGVQIAEINLLKTAGNKPVAEHRKMIEKNCKLSIRRQCELIDIHRSGLYYTPSAQSEENFVIMIKVDEQCLKTCYVLT